MTPFELFLREHALFQRLLRALELGDGFAVHVITVPDPLTAHAVTAEIGSDLARCEDKRLGAVLRIDMAESGDVVQTLLGTRLKKHQILLLDFTRFSLPAERLERLLLTLNEQRNRLARMVRNPLVLLLPSRMEGRLAEWAPDLWSLKEQLVVVGQSAFVPDDTSPLLPPPVAAPAPSATGSRYHDLTRIRQALHGEPDDMALVRRGIVAFLHYAEEIQHTSPYQAEGVMRHALDLATRRREALPESLEALRDLSVSHEKMGDLLLRLGETREARTHYEAALQLDQKLHDLQPEGLEALRDLSISHEKMGDLLLRLGETREARTHYEGALQLRLQLRDLQPESLEALRDLSFSHNKMGDLLLRLGATREARPHYESALQLRLRLHDLQPESLEALRDLSVSHERMGDCLLADNAYTAANSHYRQALQGCETLASLTDDPHFHLERKNIETGLKTIDEHLTSAT